MGFFSWITSDTNESISNTCSDRGALPCKVLLPDGTNIIEEEYEGYGIFGEYDIFALVAQWNTPEDCSFDNDSDRNIGIDIACYDNQNAELKYPIKIVSTNCKLSYKDALPSIGCEYQGYFYE